MIVYRSAKHSFNNARRVNDEFTINDVNAKIAADAEAMNRLPVLLH